MVAQTKPPYVRLETYFEREDKASSKSEYHDGVVVAMSGASTAHVRITTKLTRLVDSQLEGSSCEVFDSDMRVLVRECNAVYYPDLTVVCGKPIFADTPMATLLNPTLVIEVLSPSTERLDRGTKFDCYRSLESIQTCVIVSQVEPRIEVYSRQADGSWRYDPASGLNAIARLEAIGCELRLADVYARVEFPDDPLLEIKI